MTCGTGFVDFSAGVLWASSGLEFACLDPETGATIAETKTQYPLGPPVDIASEAYSLTRSGQLVSFPVPEYCRT
jgi:hypothetical protein